MTSTPENLTLTVSAESLVPLVEKAVERALDDRDNVGDPAWSVERAAKYADVHPHTIRAWIRQGLLPKVDLGKRCVRVRRSALDEFLDQRTVNYDDVIKRVLEGGGA